MSLPARKLEHRWRCPPGAFVVREEDAHEMPGATCFLCRDGMQVNRPFYMAEDGFAAHVDCADARGFGRGCVGGREVRDDPLEQPDPTEWEAEAAYRGDV